MDGAPGDSRLRALVDAGMALTSELSLEALLQRLIEAAAELTQARYGALGVIDATGSRLERFVVHGIDEKTREAIGELPQGRGILGALLHEAKPLRLHDLTHDPRSVGFPAGHPAMRSFLGVPVVLRGIAFGNLYLTEKAGGGDFSTEDEELVTLLAAQAAVAIENARLYEAATRWSAQLESLIEVGNALTTETDRDRLLDLIVRRLRELLDARLVTVALPGGADELRFAAASGEGSETLVGQTAPRADSKSGRVLSTGRSERVDSVIGDPEVNQEISRRMGARTGLWVPLTVAERVIGVLAAHDKLDTPDARFDDADLRLAETFAARAAVAVDLSERVARDALRRVVAAQEVERRRLARELHDETGQALTSILLGLRALDELAPGEEAQAAVAALRELTVSTLQGVRRLSVELRPKALDDFGLVAALERLTDTWRAATGIAIDFTARLGEAELSSESATALYRIVQESLTNIVKHAHARHVSVLLTRKNESVVAVIEDDGRGFDPGASVDGSGLEGMRERVALLDGRLQVESAPETGTTLVVEVPFHVSIRVLIVDDHAVVRAGLRLLIDAEKDMETIGEAGNVREAVFEARASKPDLVLMDVVMPGESGLEGIPKLLHEQADLKVLVLSMQDDPRYVREAFAAGAAGYVLKEAADAEVVHAIREVARGGRYVHPELGARMVAADAEAERRAGDDPLSDREREVLRLLARGYTNQEIAKQLYISVRTAETHRAHVMQKLRLATRAELVSYAIANGLLEE